MPGTTVSRGNILNGFLASVTLTWSGSVSGSSTAEVTAPVPGLSLGDMVSLSMQNAAQTTGLIPINTRVSAADTLSAQFANTSGGALTPSSGPYLLCVSRPESVQYLPTSAL